VLVANRARNIFFSTPKPLFEMNSKIIGLMAAAALTSLPLLSAAQKTSVGVDTRGQINDTNANLTLPQYRQGISDNNNTRASTAMPNDGSVTAMERGDATTTIGGIDRQTFDTRNREGSAKVAAIQPTATPLSAADQKLLAQMAAGGAMQLQMSQAAMPKLTRDDARVLAQSEVEEQTGLSAKLQEIAAAKRMTLPTTPDPELPAAMRELNAATAPNADAFYVRRSGVAGHKKLERTMTTVLAQAKDPALRAIAEATLPVIRMHMQVSNGVVAAMSRR